MTADCKTCHVPISWVYLTKADGTVSRHPVDAMPDEAGNIAVRRDGRMLVARMLPDGEPPAEGEKRGISHFATCTDPAAWRKRGRS